MSRIYHQPSPLIRQERRTADQLSLIQKPRDVVHSQIFWLKMSIPFTGSPVELITAYSQPQGFDCIVRGAWSDSTDSRVTVIESRTKREWSTDYVPVRSIFGNSNQVQPLFYWGTPVLLENQDQLRADFLNANSEPARTACFYAEIIGNDRHPGDGIIPVRHSMSYWLNLDLSTVNATTAPCNNDLLIWGATTNAPVTTTGRIFNQSTNFAWSSEAIPLRAMAGVDGQVQPIMRFRRPYLLPANVKMRAEINTAITNQFFTFICERVMMG